MAHPSLKKLAGFDPSGQSKTLLSEHPGRVAVLLENGKTTAMQFAGSQAALRWCEKNSVAFYYLPPAPVAKN